MTPPLLGGCGYCHGAQVQMSPQLKSAGITLVKWKSGRIVRAKKTLGLQRMRNIKQKPVFLQLVYNGVVFPSLQAFFTSPLLRHSDRPDFSCFCMKWRRPFCGNERLTPYDARKSKRLARG